MHGTQRSTHPSCHWVSQNQISLSVYFITLTFLVTTILLLHVTSDLKGIVGGCAIGVHLLGFLTYFTCKKSDPPRETRPVKPVISTHTSASNNRSSVIPPATPIVSSSVTSIATSGSGSNYALPVSSLLTSSSHALPVTVSRLPTPPGNGSNTAAASIVVSNVTQSTATNGNGLSAPIIQPLTPVTPILFDIPLDHSQSASSPSAASPVTATTPLSKAMVGKATAVLNPLTWLTSHGFEADSNVSISGNSARYRGRISNTVEYFLNNVLPRNIEIVESNPTSVLNDVQLALSIIK